MLRNCKKEHIKKKSSLKAIFSVKTFGSIANILKLRKINNAKTSFLDFFLYYIVCTSQFTNWIFLKNKPFKISFLCYCWYKIS